MQRYFFFFFLPLDAFVTLSSMFLWSLQLAVYTLNAPSQKIHESAAAFFSFCQKLHVFAAFMSRVKLLRH